MNTKEEKCIQVFSKKSLYFDDGHNKPKKYMYDYVFAEDSTQDEVYQTTTSPLIKDVLKGYSAAVFAYGATGSGKFDYGDSQIEKNNSSSIKMVSIIFSMYI